MTTKEEVDFLSQHKGNVSFEITPQHLTLTAPECYEKLGTYAQMNPPIRNKTHQNRLWYGVRNNFLDIIGSDHAPHLKENKDKNYPDLTIVDMNAKILIKNENIESKCKWSPFVGMEFRGKPVLTVINGQIKMKDRKILGVPTGQPLVF